MWGVTAPVGVTHPQVAEPREGQGGWAGKASSTTCLPLRPGGGSPEPGSADHQRLKDHSAQAGEGLGCCGQAGHTEGVWGSVKKKTVVMTLVSTLEHLGDACHGACPHLTFTAAL